MADIVWFGEESSTVHGLVGGKGANLGRLTRAGFAVPPGFTVTTEAHGVFLLGGGLLDRMIAVLDEIDPDDPATVAPACARVREAVLEHPMPSAVTDAIRAAYAELSGEPYVAVRSSGTAEDLAGASFAGLHDTYLDIRGADDVVSAVQACWASLFTERATTYRASRGFDHRVARMGVVVQRMVESEAAGVMFTGNPLTEAGDELVINSSWGLGEAVVQGAVNPDQITVRHDDLRVLDRVIGHKTVQMIRNTAGKGVVEAAVPADRADRISIPDDVLGQLADLGRRVQDYYDGIPQDIEWAVVGSGDDTAIYLLQSRPITGVNFAWDHEVGSFQKEEEDPDAVWSRVLADDVWTGAITPLMFSDRGQSWVIDYRDAALAMIPDPELARHRVMKYFKGEAYVNTAVEQAFMRWAPPVSRAGMAVRIPTDMHEVAMAQPFSWLDYVKAMARARVAYGRNGSPYGWMRYLDDCFANRCGEAQGLDAEALRPLSDAALKRYITRQWDFEHQYNVALIWPGMFYCVRDFMVALNLILHKWYTGSLDPLTAFTHLVTGTENITVTLKEHLALHEMAGMIRGSERLAKDFANHRDDAFFATLAEHEDGQALQVKIDAFMAESGHRGHADRDIYFPRYADDAGVFYRALEAHTKSDEDPMRPQRANNARREEVRADIEANLRKQPVGGLKVEAFKYVLTYVLRFLEYRDNERHFTDRNAYSIRLAYQEVNRRVRERGRLNTDRDFWFLTRPELYAVLDGHYNPALTAAKVKGRMHNFDRFDRRDWSPPKFIRRNRTHVEVTAELGADGMLRGIPTSSGTVTGTARVVRELSKIGRVQRGDILVANSTDPGWTPVFALLSGVVVETGGLLSHSSCLAREYGFPAAQVEGALQLIPDGATITIDGDAGTVVVHEPASS
jgi:pyruvate,water dikinase